MHFTQKHSEDIEVKGTTQNWKRDYSCRNMASLLLLRSRQVISSSLLNPHYGFRNFNVIYRMQFLSLKSAYATPPPDAKTPALNPSPSQSFSAFLADDLGFSESELNSIKKKNPPLFSSEEKNPSMVSQNIAKNKNSSHRVENNNHPKPRVEKLINPSVGNSYPLAVRVEKRNYPSPKVGNVAKIPPFTPNMNPSVTVGKNIPSSNVKHVVTKNNPLAKLGNVMKTNKPLGKFSSKVENATKYNNPSVMVEKKNSSVSTEDATKRNYPSPKVKDIVEDTKKDDFSPKVDNVAKMKSPLAKIENNNRSKSSFEGIAKHKKKNISPMDEDVVEMKKPSLIVKDVVEKILCQKKKKISCMVENVVQKNPSARVEDVVEKNYPSLRVEDSVEQKKTSPIVQDVVEEKNSLPVVEDLVKKNYPSVGVEDSVEQKKPSIIVQDVFEEKKSSPMVEDVLEKKMLEDIVEALKDHEFRETQIMVTIAGLSRRNLEISKEQLRSRLEHIKTLILEGKEMRAVVSHAPGILALKDLDATLTSFECLFHGKENLFKALKSIPDVLDMKPETVAMRMKFLQGLLGVSRGRAFDIICYQPRLLMSSEDDIRRCAEFLVQNGVDLNQMAVFPEILSLSIKKRIKPRIEAFRLLSSSCKDRRILPLAQFIVMRLSSVLEKYRSHGKQLLDICKSTPEKAV